MISVIHLTLIVLLAYLNPSDGKCTLAPLDSERHIRQPIAYVCIHGDLQDLQDVPSNTEWIEFTVSHLHQIPADAFSRFNDLKRLTFYNCQLRDISQDAFRGLDNLEWLIMSNTKMQVARAAMFKHVKNLKLLTLDSVELSYVEPEVFQILGKKLESLNLRNNDLNCLPIDDLAKMGRLKTIRIDENPWLCDCRSALENLMAKHRIRHEGAVDLRDYARQKRWQWQYNESYYHQSSTRVYDCMAVLQYPQLPSVKTVDSYQSRIEWRESTTNSITYLDYLPDNSGWIEVFNVHIPKLKRYTFFRFGNSLRSILLKDCGIREIEPEAFAGLHKLERLAISGAQLTVVANYWFQDLTRLTDLVLERDSIETFEFGALNHLRNLRQLDLTGNRINCLAVENLEQLRLLQRIEAMENPWYCSCRRNLENWLLKNQIGYGMSSSRTSGTSCLDENDTSVARPVTDYTYYNASSTGRIRWSWGYEVQARKPVERPTTLAPPVIIDRPSTPVVNLGGCRPVASQQYYHNPRYNHLKGLTYACAQGSLADLKNVPPNVETIIITNNALHTLENDFLRKFNGYLRRLEIRNCAINTIEHGAFASLYNLESLIIRDNNIGTVTLDWFGRDMRNLRHLDLSRNNIGRIENNLFDCVPNLISLDISENKLNCIGVEQLEKLRYLRELRITGNPWTCLCATRLERFIQNKEISCPNGCLDSVLYDNGMSTWGGCHVDRPRIPTVPSIFRPTSTPTITTTEVPITEAYNVTGTCSATNERTHYFCNNGDKFIINNIPTYVRSIEIYDSHIPYIPAGWFSRFRNLTELTIRGCSVEDIDPRAFHGLYKLEKLVITDNRLSVIRNSWFRDCKSLYWLDLSKNNLMEIEAGAFDNLQHLQYLNIEENAFLCIYTGYFTEQDQNWRRLPRLKVLEFGNNPLKWRCYQELRQFLEVRTIGYTYFKCPHDSKALVRELLNENKMDGTVQSAGFNLRFDHFTFLLVILLFNIF
ncbi:GSCOCG00013521001-RA-CDS [Cotesia congregata]|uniref:Similar to SLIT2: Slit homolog 2 protein (Homo sapiens) n=1 Tax=Cotesia congregata TaxID=51543 RepID=A0A8J2EDE1_COTCN|nr:GSCOCG00013521001-RA-CDS [Cotesia congregata]CAG5076009.1 Similar to SLIT2: Slit homolog 2 protein (Homo sapiens) [Cotesia congregata]